jgi:hypothetical protein
MFDAAVASVLHRGSTTPSASRGLHPLKTRPEGTSQAARLVARSLAGVDSSLRAVFRRLVAGEAPWPLYLFGRAGTGKTSAALVLLDHCGRPPRENDIPCRDLHDWLYGYAEVRALAGLRIRADEGKFWTAGDSGGFTVNWRWLLSAWQSFPLAVLDEIGIGATTSDFKLDVLLEVLNARCDDPVRPLVVTGNLAPKELESVYDDRIASRVLAGTVFQLDGNDRRIVK